MHDLDQLFRGLGARIIARQRGIDHVLENIVLHHLGDEAVERASTGRRLLARIVELAVGNG